MEIVILWLIPQTFDGRKRKLLSAMIDKATLTVLIILDNLDDSNNYFCFREHPLCVCVLQE